MPEQPKDRKSIREIKKTTPFNRTSEERRRLQAHRARVDKIENVVLGVVVGVGLVAAFAALVCLGALIFLAAWNLGVVGIAGAAGASVGTINFATAVGAFFLVGVVKEILAAGRNKPGMTHGATTVVNNLYDKRRRA